MNYAELSAALYRRSRMFTSAQTDAMEAYCEAERDLKELQAENTKLQAENAKLRELVADMYACIEALCSMVENSPGCSMCPTNQDEERPCAAADVYCRMCELGVEVDG